MAKALHVVDYLADPKQHAPQPVCVVFGDEPFLKRRAIAQLRHDVLGGGDADFSFSSFEGASAALPDVLEELATLAMFGSARRLALVEEADDFVSRYRDKLEDYVARPHSSGVLLLEVRTWPGNTRLAKAVGATGLAIDCSALAESQLTRWLTAWAKQAHAVQLSSASASTLVEMVGTELGLLDQELAKLALVAGAGGKITAEHIGQFVGTWRAKTTWKMLDAVLDGKAAEAMVELDRLLLAGEEPIAILAQISSSLRRFATATRLILAAEAAGRKIPLRGALEQAGFKSYFLKDAERRLRRFGRQRGAVFFDWLLEVDLDLKGGSPLPSRLILERLMVRLSAPTPEKV